jgi:hypothetical protein
VIACGYICGYTRDCNTILICGGSLVLYDCVDAISSSRHIRMCFVNIPLVKCTLCSGVPIIGVTQYVSLQVGLTADSLEQQQRDYLAAGLDLVLTKPLLGTKFDALCEEWGILHLRKDAKSGVV